MLRFRNILLAAASVGLAACSSRTVVVTSVPAPETHDVQTSTAATLGIPPGHLPPPGRCRVWIPGRPAGHQPSPRTCEGAVRNAPPGSMVLYRPTQDRKYVRVQYVDRERAGVVVRIRLFDAASGALVREEKG